MSERIETEGLSAKPKDSEAELLRALRAGHEPSFAALLDRLSPSMLGYARSILFDPDLAAEVVQETWLAAIQGLEQFEGRSTLKTWIFSILTNAARTRAKRERRTVAFSSLTQGENPAEAVAAVAPQSTDHRHAWMSPARWSQTQEERMLSTETIAVIRKTLASMPRRQADVVELRDVEGRSAAEACRALGVSERNQRVLLHRGRAKIRNAVASYRHAVLPETSAIGSLGPVARAG